MYWLPNAENLDCDDIEFADEDVEGFDEDDEFGCYDIPMRLLKNVSLLGY